jgi:sulfur carrier protein
LGAERVLVTVNGEERALQDGATVGLLVESMGVPGGGRGVAVAVGGQVVPRSAWELTELQPGAVIEVLVAVQGG